MDEEPEKEPTPAPVPTVAGQVLTTFFDELDKQPELSDISVNLRKVVMSDGVLAEAAIRSILFPDAP